MVRLHFPLKYLLELVEAEILLSRYLIWAPRYGLGALRPLAKTLAELIGDTSAIVCLALHLSVKREVSPVI